MTETESDDHHSSDDEQRQHTATCFLIDQLYIRKVIGRDHHFYGIQLITMRKLFLSKVSMKIGMLMVRSDDDDAAETKPIPMEEGDYNRVMRRIKNYDHMRLIRDICHEDADPGEYYRFGASHHLRSAFDALEAAVVSLWEEKKAEIENACKEYGNAQ